MTETKKSPEKAETFQEKLIKTLKDKKLLLPSALSVAFLIDLLIIYGMVASPENSCFGSIAIGILTPLTFLWFKIDRPKDMLIYMTVVFLILSPVAAVIYAGEAYSSDPVVYSHDGLLKDGKVSPHVWNGNAHEFNFTVELSRDKMKKNYTYTVYVNITNPDTKETINETMNKSGDIYYREIRLEKGLYFFYYIVKANNSNESAWNITNMYSGIWPAAINMDRGELTMKLLPITFGGVFLNSAFLSYIIVGMYWWTRIAKERKRRMVTVKKPEIGEELKCPICGNRIAPGTKTCPYCGAELEYEEENGDEEKDDEAGENKE